VHAHRAHYTVHQSTEVYPVTAIVDEVGKDLCLNLPKAYALSGCDTTSSFFKIGKRTAKLVELIKIEPDTLKAFGGSVSI